MPRGRPRSFDIDASLDAAMMLFWRHGYEGTSLSALTRAMKINGPSLYNTYGDKRTLFLKALDRYLHRKAVYLPNALKAPTAREAIETLFRGAIDLAANPRNPDGCFLVHGALATGPMNKSIRKAMDLRRAYAEAAVRRRLEIAITAGELPADADSAKLAAFVITVVWGMSVQAAGGATREQLENVAEMALRCWPAKPA